MPFTENYKVSSMAKSQSTQLRCSQSGCTLGTDGQCLENLSLELCPHIFRTGISQAASINSDISDVPSNFLQLFEDTHVGMPLEMEECPIVMCESLTRVIMLAGLADAGKSTLLSAIFQIFQDNPSFAGYAFEGSRTLIGFEKLSHESRIKSGLSKPNTIRTPQGPPKFLHLIVQDNNAESSNLLFTDISGEAFKKLSNSTEECKKFELARRADHFALFLDSDLLSMKEERQQVKANSLSVLHSLLDAGMLSPDVHIQIVFSRWDKLLKKKDQEHIDFVNSLQSEIDKKFKNTNFRISFHQIASRPDEDSSLDFGHGIDLLLPKWVTESAFDLIAKKTNLLKVEPQREFLKFKTH
jgi:hypothetical protein